MPALLPDIVIIFALAVVAALACHRLRLPMPIGLLLVGVLAGPDALGLVRGVHEIELLSEIGVVLLLFVIGLEFSLADLAQLKRHFLVGGSVQFFGTAGLVGAGLLLAGVTPPQGLYLGFVIALSSTAIVLRLLQERAELDSPHGRAALATLIYQDIAVVPVMLLAPLLAGAATGTGLTQAGSLLLRVAGVGTFSYAAYKWIVPWILERITRTRSPEAFLLGVVLLCIGIALLTQALGLSLALGAFLAGLIISESEYSNQAVAVMLPFRDVFLSLFFVSTGMLLDIQYLLAHPLLLGLLTLGVLVVKPLLATAAALALGLPLRPAVQSGLALGQVGEFSLVAAKAGVVAGLLLPDHFQAVLNLAVITMLLTPLLIAAGPPSAVWLARTPLARLARRGVADVASGTDHPQVGHVLIVGFGVTGRNVARTARLADLPYLILEINAGILREAAAQGEPIHYGDATQESILRHVDADKARAVVVLINDPAGTRRIVELARRIAPDAYLLVRSRTLREVEPLIALGADEVIADELEVSIEVFSRVLARMLVPREDIKRLIGEVRGDWRRMARSFAKDATVVPVSRIHIPDLSTHSLRLGADSPLVGRTIATSGLRPQHGVTVLAITRAGHTLGNPHSDEPLLPGDVLFVISPLDWDPATVS
ncbi:MAG: cation:proton antiporter [bacterium]|nr:cation:proton antiporter [bacterium]